MAAAKLPFVCLLLALVSSSALGTSIASVSASAGTNNCNQSTSDVASCSVGFGTTAASAFATTLGTGGSGALEATAFGSGLATSSGALAGFTDMLVVTGASGAGELEIDFVGFQMSILNTPGGATVSPFSVGVGTYATNVTLPNGAPSPFSVVAPITFNVSTVFSASISASATGGIFHDGTGTANDADGKILFPTFVVTDATGKVIPGAKVSFVPEPATWVGVGLGLVLLAHRRRILRP